MRVLSIKEPFASLICEGIKHIETRSWKTNYRGEIYIHASLAKVPKNDERINCLMKMLNDKELNMGKIICKCKLVDCVYMTEEYIKDMKENNEIEYLCGHYEVGRYSWVLEDVEVLDEKFEAKGRLGIWHYNDRL